MQPCKDSPFQEGDVVANRSFPGREFVVIRIRLLKWKSTWTMELGIAGEVEPEVVLGNQYVTQDWKKV
jgi:hypothetical protein